MLLYEETVRESEWKAFVEWKARQTISLTLQEEAEMFNDCFTSFTNEEENENEYHSEL